ncbi:MAG: TolC family protein [Archangium sp.]|nr:TolC family protein [Archangium sp.]MDP3154826.1 TolC family protein [Archangium sp.]MDP3575038.1 TolC family protein [Archangium sp.]
MMKPTILIALLAAGCATTGLNEDLASIRRTVTARAAVAEFDLPRLETPEAVPEEVDRLLEQPLTADAAVRLALINNREARASLAEIGIARGQFMQAGLVPNPEVEFELRDPGGDQQPIQIDIGLELNLTATFLAPLRAGVASAALDAERWKAAGALLDLTWSTRVAYYEAQALQQKLDLRLRAFASQQASYETALELSRVGNLPALALANELAAVELSRVQVAEAENALLDGREALTRKLGLTGSRTRWTFADQLPVPKEVPTGDAVEAKAIEASLELAELFSRAEAASRKVGMAKTEAWLPHLSAGFHGERDANLWELGGHVTVGLPIFDRAQGRQLSARSEYDGLRARAEGQALQVRSAVRMTLNRVESAGRRARHYAERLVPARQQQLEQTVLQYNAMQVGVFQVLSAQREVTEAAISQVDATLDAWKARAALELLLAGRSTPLVLGAVPGSNSMAVDSSGGH